MLDFPRGELIDCGEVELEVFQAGQGIPLVLCHGWPEHAFSWRHQIPALVDAGYHVIVPRADMTGYVPDLETHELESGHWIQQEQPAETNRILLEWLDRRMKPLF